MVSPGDSALWWGFHTPYCEWGSECPRKWIAHNRQWAPQHPGHLGLPSRLARSHTDLIYRVRRVSAWCSWPSLSMANLCLILGLLVSFSTPSDSPNPTFLKPIVASQPPGASSVLTPCLSSLNPLLPALHHPLDLHTPPIGQTLGSFMQIINGESNTKGKLFSGHEEQHNLFTRTREEKQVKWGSDILN